MLPLLMEPLQTYQYKLAFNLKVRSSYWTAFQDFFSTVMERTHCDFVRVRPFGSVGDKGCDGYKASTGQVFQCFGKLEDAAVNVAKLVSKMQDDYALASAHLKQIMKQWHFAHNLVDGLPIDAVTQFEAMKKANPTHGFGLISPVSLEGQVLSLSPADLLELLGPAATAEDTGNLRMEEVRDLVKVLMSTIDETEVRADEVRPVPADKLEFNDLPQHWVQLISAASKNEQYVRQYFAQHPNPETGNIVATVFANRYRSLKLEHLTPGLIMDRLYEEITGIGTVTAARQVAAQALLAYLFDACEIFEEDPAKVGS